MNERGIIVNWLLKLLIGFAVVSVVLYDVGSVMVNFFTLDSRADEIAVQVSSELGRNFSVHQERQYEEVAMELARESDARLVDFRIDKDLGILYVSLRRRAPTLVVRHIPPIADWARATAEGQAGTG